MWNKIAGQQFLTGFFCGVAGNLCWGSLTCSLQGFQIEKKEYEEIVK